MWDHIFIHVLKAGGIPALVGAGAAGFATFPRDQPWSSSSPYGILTPIYHSWLYDNLPLGRAMGYMSVAVFVGAIIGIGFGALLVETGIISARGTKGELYGDDN
jgi:hypothetical protein